MDSAFSERLLAWWENTDHKLKTKWWLWPIGFAIALGWHRVLAKTNDFLDSRGVFALTALTHVPSDPVSVAIIISLLIFVGLSLHAYIDTRKAVTAGPKLPIAEPQKSALDMANFHLLRNQFERLTWGQKIALKLICTRTHAGYHELALYQDLQNLGFGKDVMQDIIAPLRGTWFVEFDPQGTVRVRPDRTGDIVEKLLNGWNANAV